jgi:hypothetical protein
VARENVNDLTLTNRSEQDRKPGNANAEIDTGKNKIQSGKNWWRLQNQIKEQGCLLEARTAQIQCIREEKQKLHNPNNPKGDSKQISY